MSPHGEIQVACLWQETTDAVFPGRPSRQAARDVDLAPYR